MPWQMLSTPRDLLQLPLKTPPRAESRHELDATAWCNCCLRETRTVILPKVVLAYQPDYFTKEMK